MLFDFPTGDVILVKDYEIPNPNEEPEPGARWKLTFDGASNDIGHWSRVVLITPNNGYITSAASIYLDCTNKIVEYEASIMGLEAAIDLRMKTPEVYRDSALIICQVKGEWVTLHPTLIPYSDYVL